MTNKKCKRIFLLLLLSFVHKLVSSLACPKKSAVPITLLIFEAQHSHPPPSAEAFICFPCGHPICTSNIPSLPLSPPTLHSLYPPPLHSWPPQLMTPLPLVLPLPLLLPFSLCISLCLPLFFFSSLPVTTIGAVARRRRLLCGFNTWFLNLAVLCRQALKRELWSRLHQGK